MSYRLDIYDTNNSTKLDVIHPDKELSLVHDVREFEELNGAHYIDVLIDYESEKFASLQEFRPKSISTPFAIPVRLGSSNGVFPYSRYRRSLGTPTFRSPWVTHT